MNFKNQSTSHFSFQSQSQSHLSNSNNDELNKEKHPIYQTNSRALTHEEFGVGARFTVNVMCNEYVDILLNALSKAPLSRVSTKTDSVSTYVSGQEADIANYIVSVLSQVASHGHHVTSMIMFSRGCPGELSCQLPDKTFFPELSPITLNPTGIKVLAHWSLYPLFDDKVDSFSHMTEIYRAIDFAKSKQTFKGQSHYVTELEGDLADVIETIIMGWFLVGKTVQHVTTHATLSIHSPTQQIANS